MSEHDGFHIMPMYYRASTHAIPIRAGQTDIGIPIQDIIIQAMGDRDAKLASARAENERLRMQAWVTMPAQIAELEGQVGRLKAVVQRLEWREGTDFDYSRECLVCDEWEKDGHADDCALAAALAKNP